MVFALAYRNLSRNLRRTMLAEISVIFGVLVIIGTGNFLNGMQRNWATFEIRANTGAFQVEHRDYKELGKAEPLKMTLEGATALAEKIRGVPGVTAAFGKLKFTGMVSSGLKSTFFEGVGVDVARQAQTLPRQEDLIAGGRQLDATTAGGVILGADLADSLGIKIGDPVTIVVQTFHGGLNLTYGTLVGVKNGRHFPSSTYLEMRLEDAQQLLRAQDRVSQVVVAASDFGAIPEIMRRVDGELAHEAIPFVMRGYPELIPIYASAVASFTFVSRIVGLVLFMLVAAGVGNVMAMAVMERKREVGTMRALGMDQAQIRRLFLAEGFVIGGIGAVVGFALATGLTAAVAAHGGFHLPPPPGTTQSLSISPALDPAMSIFGVVMPLLVGLIAAWWPAAAAARLSPVQALTEV